MNRPALITLRILAIGSALTVLGCLVANNQKRANAAAAGDRGQPGPAAQSSQTAAPASRPATWASSSKSLTGPVLETSVATGAADSARRYMGGTKSARVVSPRDIQGQGQQSPPVPPDPQKTKEEAARHLSRGNGFYDLGHFPEASAEFAIALRLDPNNVAARSGLDKTQKALTPPVTVPASNAPANPPPSLRGAFVAPSSKSGPAVRAEDVRQFRQSVNPPAQQAAPRQQ